MESKDWKGRNQDYAQMIFTCVPTYPNECTDELLELSIFRRTFGYNYVHYTKLSVFLYTNNQIGNSIEKQLSRNKSKERCVKHIY